MEYYRLGEKYYLDKNTKDALKNFAKVYNINKNLFETKYYYTMSLLRVDQSVNSMLANKILYENYEYLNDYEKVVYAMLECNQKNHLNCSMALAEIKEPLYIKNDIFNQYIMTSTIANFELDFNDGQNTVFNNKILIDRKINSLGLLSDYNIKKFDDVIIELDTQAFFKEEMFKYKSGAMEMFILYLNKCMEKKSMVEYFLLWKWLQIILKYLIPNKR